MIGLLATATTLEICLELLFTRAIALLQSKQHREWNSFSTTANYCIALTIARTIATEPFIAATSLVESTPSPNSEVSLQQLSYSYATARLEF